MGLVDFDLKSRFWFDFDGKTQFWLILAKTPRFSPKKCFWSIFTEKPRLDPFWLILALKLGFISSIKILVPAGFEPGTSGATVLNVTIRPGPISEVKPGQAHLLLGWAT